MVQRLSSDDASLHKAADCLARGGLVAFPTETVYGLGADALSPSAVAKIFQAKGRPSDHPVIVHVAGVTQAQALAVQWPAAADCLAHAFWPGPLTLILKKASAVPVSVTGGQDTVGLRVPSHPVALNLLKAFAELGSGAIAAPSANRFGGVSPTRACDVLEDLGPWLAADDIVLEGGSSEVGLESTIVDCSVATPRLLRPGGVPREAIQKVLHDHGMALAPALESGWNSGQEDPGPAVACVPRVSGSLASHYAPRTPLWVLPADALHERLGHYAHAHPLARVLCWLFPFTALPKTLGQAHFTVQRAPSDAVRYGQELYARLHDWDRQGYDLLCIEAPPVEPIWEAVHDRLQRAAA